MQLGSVPNCTFNFYNATCTILCSFKHSWTSKILWFSEPLNFNVDLQVVKITKKHPSINEPATIEFSNESPDMAKIQQRINERMNNANSSIAFGGWNVNNISYTGYSDVMGSVLTNGWS